jgi:hypothetical protein
LIIFVTDIRSPAETDILQGREHFFLILAPLFSDEGLETVRIAPPAAGWTHELLCMHSSVIDAGDAYLVKAEATPFDPKNATWIGSSEV